MSHTIASVTHSNFLPRETGPGIAAVSQQPSFGFQDEDAFEKTEPVTRPTARGTSQAVSTPGNPLFALIQLLRRWFQNVIERIRVFLF